MPTNQAILFVLALGVALPAQATNVLVRDVAIEGSWKDDDQAGVDARRECLGQVLAARYRVTQAAEAPRSQWLRRLLLADATALVEGPVEVEDLRVNRRKLARLRGQVDPTRLDLCWAQAGEFLDHLGSPSVLFNVRPASGPASIEQPASQPSSSVVQALFVVRERLRSVGFTVVDSEVAGRLRRQLCEREKLEVVDAAFLQAVAEKRLADFILHCDGGAEGPVQGLVRGARTTSFSGSFVLEAVSSQTGLALGSGRGNGKAGDRDQALVLAAEVACDQLIEGVFAQWNREAFGGRGLKLHVDLPVGADAADVVIDAVQAVAGVVTTSPESDRQGVDAVVTTKMSTCEYGRLLRVELAKRGLRADSSAAGWALLRLRIVPGPLEPPAVAPSPLPGKYQGR